MRMRLKRRNRQKKGRENLLGTSEEKEREENRRRILRENGEKRKPHEIIVMAKKRRRRKEGKDKARNLLDIKVPENHPNKRREKGKRELREIGRKDERTEEKRSGAVTANARKKHPEVVRKDLKMRGTKDKARSLHAGKVLGSLHNNREERREKGKRELHEIGKKEKRKEQKRRGAEP